MSKSVIHTIIHTLGSITVVVLSFLLFKACNKEVEVVEVPIIITDTVTVDSIRIVEHTKVKYMTKYDTIIRTVYNLDTIETVVELPIEHKVYKDTITTDTTETEINIKYSGFKATLDSVSINYHYAGKAAVEVPKNIKGFRQFIGIGITAGYGATLSTEKTILSPSVSIGITYGIGYTWSARSR